jgi:hypothetical protein
MPKTNHEASDRSAEYVKPMISDYGDLVETTAAGETGRHVDHKFNEGELATFLSSSP